QRGSKAVAPAHSERAERSRWHSGQERDVAVPKAQWEASAGDLQVSSLEIGRAGEGIDRVATNDLYGTAERAQALPWRLIGRDGLVIARHKGHAALVEAQRVERDGPGLRPITEPDLKASKSARRECGTCNAGPGHREGFGIQYHTEAILPVRTLKLEA